MSCHGHLQHAQTYSTLHLRVEPYVEIAVFTRSSLAAVTVTLQKENESSI
jgi:hypothetical protein